MKENACAYLTFVSWKSCQGEPPRSQLMFLTLIRPPSHVESSAWCGAEVFCVRAWPYPRGDQTRFWPPPRLLFGT
ncbi:hypothetical protein CEXT_146421 [Caerostris extrusa]|uniref:Uncharacterized protein n=1 Tax=Caerostris extrusa TaxID=172846 RepID=A0AAV4MI35_CAEEX|nr:hypothetical protein CEXT_146421 [Caerostris extrusa]